MDNISRVTQDYEMKINVKNTRLLCISHKEDKMKIYIDSQVAEQVKQFKYLGKIIT